MKYSLRYLTFIILESCYLSISQMMVLLVSECYCKSWLLHQFRIFKLALMDNIQVKFGYSISFPKMTLCISDALVFLGLCQPLWYSLDNFLHKSCPRTLSFIQNDSQGFILIENWNSSGLYNNIFFNLSLRTIN